MKRLLSYLVLLLVPFRLAAVLGEGSVFSRKRLAIVARCYQLFLDKARKRERPVELNLFHNGVRFSLTVESSADLAALREVFLDHEYRHAPRKDVRHVFDVGANIGAASIYLHSLYPEAVIHAFEPDPRLYARLARHVAALPSIRTYPLALAGSDGVRTFYASKSPLAGSLLQREATKEYQVEARTIASVVDELGVERVDLLKFDIEGGERELFANEKNRRRVRYAIGELHLDVLGETLKDFSGMMEGFRLTPLQKAAGSRPIVSFER
jgi:FkbM family methyltransferase